MTFMEAADESKRQGGKPVKLETVLKKAQAQALSKTAKVPAAIGNCLALLRGYAHRYVHRHRSS